MVKNNVKSQTKLCSIVNEFKKAGKRDLANFVLSHLMKALSGLLENTWKMESISKKICRSRQTHMEMINKHSRESCADSCNGKLLKYAFEVFQESNIHPLLFRAAVRKLLQMGLRKSRNILIIVSCTKTFLLRPIELFFDTFCTPSINKYSWIVVDGKEVLFLNNFWCSCKLIPWEAFLVLLEREVVHFP